MTCTKNHIIDYSLDIFDKTYLHHGDYESLLMKAERMLKYKCIHQSIYNKKDYSLCGEFRIYSKEWSIDDTFVYDVCCRFVDGFPQLEFCHYEMI